MKTMKWMAIVYRKMPDDNETSRSGKINEE